MPKQEFIPEGKTIANKYTIIKRIAGGAFGVLYTGKNIETEARVVLKFEKNRKQNSPSLKLEYETYQQIKGALGFPKIHYYGTVDHRPVLVMDALGPSLEDMLQICGGKLSLKTVLMLVDQMVRRIRKIHEIGLIHRDIKPENFVMGRGTNFHRVYLIDLGLVEPYFDTIINDHAPEIHDIFICGTPLFMSLNAHAGFSQSRRNDMEGLGYAIVYLLKGRLPWQDVEESADEDKVMELLRRHKRSTTASELCQSLPKEFKDYMVHCRNLRYEEEPNYQHILDLFRNVFKSKAYKRDFDYDWMKILCKQPNKPEETTTDEEGNTNSEETLLEKCVSLAQIPFDYKEFKNSKLS